MITKVRLQRKFKQKTQFNYSFSFFLIIKTQIVFELLLIFFTCLLNLSLQFHFGHIFTCQFWVNQQIASYNIAFLISNVLIAVLLIHVQKIKVSLISDAYFSLICVHSLMSFLYNFKYSLGYLIYVTVIGIACSTVVKYVAMILQQKKLIQQICEIESEDRKNSVKTIHQESEEAGLTTFENQHH